MTTISTARANPIHIESPGPSSPWPWSPKCLWCWLLIGLGVGLVFVAVSITALAGIPAQHAGMASGFLMTGHEIGAALGVAVLAAVATPRA